MQKTYRHFGCPKFELELYDPIKNIDRFSKPDGGLWGIPIEKVDEVVKFLEDTDWDTLLSRVDVGHFDFTLKEDAKVLVLKEESDFKDLPYTSAPREGVGAMKNTYFIDFEKLLENGYDAVEAIFDKQGCGDIYYHLYCWDFSSILVLNPGAIIQVENS